MPYITVPYTFVNNNVADADQVNGNFNAVTGGLSDGTKDIAVNDVSCSNVAAAGTLETARMNIAGTLTVNGMLEGSRNMIVWGNEVDGNSSGYLNGYYNAIPASTEYLSFPMTRSGSILAITSYQYVSTLVNTQTVTPIIRKNAASLIAASTLTINAGGGAKSGVASTFTRGSHVFAPGDRLSAYVVTSGTAGSAAMKTFLNIGVEVVYDT